MADSKKVMLTCDALGDREFTHKHAEKLLALQTKLKVDHWKRKEVEAPAAKAKTKSKATNNEANGATDTENNSSS